MFRNDIELLSSPIKQTLHPLSRRIDDDTALLAPASLLMIAMLYCCVVTKFLICAFGNNASPILDVTRYGNVIIRQRSATYLKSTDN